jgi:hypothetical protein
MLSVVSFITNLLDASYGQSKAAELSLTNGIRIELARQGTIAHRLRNAGRSRLRALSIITPPSF